MQTGERGLMEFIRETIRAQGPVTFAWFMEQALYHPEHGYYSSGRCEIGRRGDYFTNVSVGSIFGRLLAAQFAEMWKAIDRPAEFMIVEQGAHHGDFARDVLQAAARRSAPKFFAALRYCIIEPFPILQQRQEEALGNFSGKVTWQKSLTDLDSFRGVHFSNELLDALPVHLIRSENGEWRERYVTNEDDHFAFVSAPIRDAKLSRHVETLPRHRDRYETEVNLKAHEWIQAVAKKLSRGYILAVDYGFSRDVFYAPERTQGTLQSYAKHRAIASPLTQVGAADITAHVDWTSVAACAETCGLTVAGFTDQHHFITGVISESSEFESADAATRRTLQTLLHPEFLGTKFQFLALAKGTSETRCLSGFKFGREPRAALDL